ncbi:hypothetical protein [Pendulispora albinea]|uniref:Uncharacterized protein n=1 Tax=Pendulispora albinea TaxID=2741071 RepID=A0ABZ2MBZ7_9BACT
MSDELDSLGIRYEVEETTETVEIDGKDTTKDFVVTTLALTTPPKIQASFTHEGLGKKLVKLFKKEIQVGDPAFDDVVYVSTDTPEETAAFLKSKDTQKTILTAVAGGGSIEIDERHILARIPGKDPTGDHALAALVRIVLKA